MIPPSGLEQNASQSVTPNAPNNQMEEHSSLGGLNV
jgi:hypothetical protein